MAAITPQPTLCASSLAGPGTTVRVAGQLTLAPLGYSSFVSSDAGPGDAVTLTSRRKLSMERCASGPPRQVEVGRRESLSSPPLDVRERCVDLQGR